MNINLMKCGHIANATTNNKPCCVICNCTEIGDINTINLAGRKAKCECGRIEISSHKLFFFKHCPQCEFDSFYCGCRGWD